MFGKFFLLAHIFTAQITANDMTPQQLDINLDGCIMFSPALFSEIEIGVPMES